MPNEYKTAFYLQNKITNNNKNKDYDSNSPVLRIVVRRNICTDYLSVHRCRRT